MDMAAVQASQATSSSNTTFATIYDDLFPAMLGGRLCEPPRRFPIR
jgi:hypothetical protein